MYYNILPSICVCVCVCFIFSIYNWYFFLLNKCMLLFNYFILVFDKTDSRLWIQLQINALHIVRYINRIQLIGEKTVTQMHSLFFTAAVNWYNARIYHNHYTDNQLMLFENLIDQINHFKFRIKSKLSIKMELREKRVNRIAYLPCLLQVAPSPMLRTHYRPIQQQQQVDLSM